MLNPLHCHQRTRPPRPLPPPKLRALHPSGSLCPRHSGFPFPEPPAHSHLPPRPHSPPIFLCPGSCHRRPHCPKRLCSVTLCCGPRVHCHRLFLRLACPLVCHGVAPVLAPEQGDVSAFASGPRSGPLSEGLCVMPGSQVQASEPRPTPSYSADIHKLTCCSPGGMAAWGHHAFHGETSARGGLAAGRGDCMSPPSPPGGEALVAGTFAWELDFGGK